MTTTTIRQLVLLWAVGLALTLAPTGSAQVAPGHRLIVPTSGTNTLLADRDGTVVHVWPNAFAAGISAYLTPDGDLMRAIRTRLSGAGSGGGVQRLGLDGSVLWDFRYDSGGVQSHHDIAVMPNGNVLMIAWEDKTSGEVAAAGRNPALLFGGILKVGHIIEVMPTGPTSGAIVWEWHVWDHLVQDFDAGQANFGDPAARPELIDFNYPPERTSEFNHLNSVEYDPEHDWVVVSAFSQDEIWVIDHGTTTAEAAGHTGGARGRGGDLIYRWGNPAAYRRGTPADQQLFGQHAAKIVPPGYPGAGHMTVFNNGAPGGSSVIELELPLDGAGNFVMNAGGTYDPPAPLWTYQAPGFGSAVMSSAERLPNGNTLICSALQGRVFEVTPENAVVTQIDSGLGTPFHATYVDRVQWQRADTLSLAGGGTAEGRIEYQLIAGTPHGGDIHVVLGSVSGTSPGFPLFGQNIPLNLDLYTQLGAGSSLMPNAIGSLDANGRATIPFVLPAGVPPNLVGLTFSHATLIFDGTTAAFERVSGADSFVLVP